MILTYKPYLKMILSYAQDNTRWSKIQSVESIDLINIEAEDLLVEGLELLLQQSIISLSARQMAAAKFIKSWKLGSALGTLLAGLVYRDGFGIEDNLRDKELGNSLITVAAKGHRNPLALHFVGIGLLSENANNLAGLEYLKSASNLGCKESSFTLAVICLFRPDIVPTSYIQAIEYLHKSGEQGSKLLAAVRTHIDNLKVKKLSHTMNHIVAHQRPVFAH